MQDEKKERNKGKRKERIKKRRERKHLRCGTDHVHTFTVRNCTHLHK